METKHCLRCQQVCAKKDKFCTRCGSPLHNKCTNDGGPFTEPCNKTNDPEAAFCKHCGSPTTFHQTGLIHTDYTEGKKTKSEEWVEMDHFSHKFFTE